MLRLPRTLLAVLLAVLAFPALAGCWWDDDGGSGELVVDGGTVDVPANPDLAAVRMVIRNGTEADDRLVGASTAVADSAHVHRSGTDGAGRATMEALDAVDVPAGEEVRFAPGGLHVMLSGLREPLEAGDTFDLRLELAEAGELVVEVRVVEPGTAPEDPTAAATETEEDHRGG